MAAFKPFEVIIIGGSVAGLTLAHCLHKAGIEYTVLEARDTVSPQLGASIVIMPNGARILDQMGLYESMRARFMEKMRKSTIIRSDGRKVTENEWPVLVEERLGYPGGVCERRLFLQSLYDQLEDKSRIRLGKKVAKIEQSKTGAKVICSDGTEFCGDAVVGADGIHSRTRREMHRIAEETGPKGLLDDDRTSISAEYGCFFGISEAKYDLSLGDSVVSTEVNHSSLLFVGRDGLPQWFFFSKLDKRYIGDEIPRFTKADIQQTAENFKDFHFTEDLTFNDLISKTKSLSYLPLEEAHHEVWTYGRVVCIGDAIHKMTPNLGQGGNQAIESAAVLTNCFVEMFKQRSNNDLSQNDIEAALIKFQDLRQDRTRRFVQLSGMATRYDSLATLGHVLRFLYKKPFSGEMLATVQIDMYHTAPYLNFLPLPKRLEKNALWMKGMEKMKERDDIPTGSPFKSRL